MSSVESAAIAAPHQPAPQSLQSPVADSNEVYATICTQIVKEQSLIIGALALEQAGHVVGLSVDPATYSCRISGNGSQIVEELINQYRDFFGNAAVEVCREAASRFMTRLPTGAIPASLR